MAAKIRTESRLRFEKQGLDKVRQALARGIQNPTEKLEAQNWVVEEEEREKQKQRKQHWLLLGIAMIVVLGTAIAVWRITMFAAQ
jgi:hypothetical protein